MTALLGISIFLFGAGFFTQRVSQARQSAWAGPRTSGMRQRASHGGGHRSVRQEVKLAWANVRATNWLEQQRHHRKTGTTPGATATAVVPGGKPAAVTPIAAAAQRLAARQARPAAAPQAPPQHVSESPGRNTTVASNAGAAGAVEQLVDGVNQLHAHAQAGNVNAKHGAIKGGHEGLVRFAAMWNMLARSLGELGFGPEITEPIAKAAMHVQAGAMTISEADANLTTLLNMTLGEAAESPRQVPHHSQFAENGSR